MTEEEVRQMVRGLCPQRGDLSAFARQAGISRQRLSLFMTGVTGPGPSILRALGLSAVRAVSYVKESACGQAETRI